MKFPVVSVEIAERLESRFAPLAVVQGLARVNSVVLLKMPFDKKPLWTQRTLKLITFLTVMPLYVFQQAIILGMLTAALVAFELFLWRQSHVFAHVNGHPGRQQPLVTLGTLTLG